MKKLEFTSKKERARVECRELYLATLDFSRGGGLTQLIGGTCHHVAGVRDNQSRVII